MGGFPTRRAWVVFAFIGSALVACATSNGDPEGPTETPAEETPARERQPDNDAPPEFQADFDASPGPSKKNDEDPPPSQPVDQCVDNDDPGSAENVATVLPDTDDCDNDYKTVTGVANGAVDVDFYKLTGTDKFGCLTDTDFESQLAGTELCVFARCQNSTTDAVTGCAQGTSATSDIGMKGCCATGLGRALPNWDCSGVTDDDSADFFIRVRQTNGDQCLPYKFRYRF